jgi:NAD-dependent SIR2 family protein deacetylase
MLRWRKFDIINLSMYCSHCGYHLSDSKIEKTKQKEDYKNPTTSEAFVCPRCGHLVKTSLTDIEIKELSRASHSEIHRSRNLLNGGMSFLVIGAIVLIVSYLFFLMAHKASLGGVLETTCTEFYVFITLLSLGAVLLVFSFVYLFIGIRKHKRYSSLLKRINEGIFVQ